MEYNCNICNKLYKSYQSLWNHNNKFHNTINNEITNNNNLLTVNNNLLTVNNNLLTSNKIYKCKYCNKNYNLQQSKWSHEQKCKNIVQETNEIDKIKEEKELAKIQLQVKKEEYKILQLKIKLQKSEKIDNVTVRKLNKLLTVHNNLIKNINSHNTINNNQQIINNNFQLVGLGKEEIFETLSNYEMKIIMNAKYSSLDKLIEIVHCGKYNQFKNIIITNMKDNYMYKYDDKECNFILSTKSEVINSLIDYRLGDLEIIYNDLLEKNKLDEKTKDIIEKFINKINNESKYTDYDGKEHENYKQYKIHEIKILLFNNQDKITNDISLLLTTNNITQELII